MSTDSTIALRRVAGWTLVLLFLAAILAPLTARAEPEPAEAAPSGDESILKFDKPCGRFEPELEAKLKTVKDSEKAKSDPRFPLTSPPYPAASRRLEEKGTVLLALLVNEQGEVAASKVSKSTGFPRPRSSVR